MSKAVNAIIVGLTVFILLTGSIWYVTVGRSPNRISAVEIAQGWEEVDATSSAFWAKVTFRNPYDFRIDLVNFSYEFNVHDHLWASDLAEYAVEVQARGEAVMPIRVAFENSRMQDWLRDHVANGETTQTVLRGNATFRVGGDEITIPFEAVHKWSSKLRSAIEDLRNCPQDEPAPCIADASVKWVIDNSTVTARLVLNVRNDNLDDMIVSNRTVTLGLGDVVIATDQDASDAVIGRLGERFFEFPLTLRPNDVVQWWVGHTSACEVSEANLAVVMDYEVRAEEFPPPPPTTTSSASPSSTSTPPPSTPPPSTPPPTSTSTSSPPPPNSSSPPPSSSDPPPSSSDPPPSSSDPPPSSSDPPPTSSDPPPSSSDPPPSSSDPPPSSSDPPPSPEPTTTPGGSSAGSPTAGVQRGLPVWGFLKIFIVDFDIESLNPSPQPRPASPTTEGVERIAWQLALGDFQTKFACQAPEG